MDGGRNAHGRESVVAIAPKTEHKKAKSKWIPAFAGMTKEGFRLSQECG